MFAARRLATVLLVASAASLLGACDWLRGTSEPETVRLTIASDDVTQVRLVTSFLFSQLEDPDDPFGEPLIELLESDTTVVQLPFEQTYLFTSRLQVFLEVLPPELATLAMEVFIDDREWFNDFRLVDPNADPRPEVMRFIYTYADISF